MNWWLWTLLGFAIYNILFLFIYLCKTEGCYKFTVFLANVLVSIIVTAMFLTIPFLWIYIFIKWAELQDKDEDYQEETFIIHSLTEENKIALRQIGFQEGEFVSSHNLDYSGFRYRYPPFKGKKTIIVLYNGRVLVQGSQDKTVKAIVSIIKGLPEQESEEKLIK